MSAYCLVTDVQADFKVITFAAGQNITDTAVTQFIVEASALINSYVGQRYATPVTADTDTLALMSLFCRTLVADRIRGILANKQATNIDANQNVKADGLSTKDVLAQLIKIQNNQMNLSGAQLNLPGSTFASHNSERGVRPRFHKNRKQW